MDMKRIFNVSACCGLWILLTSVSFAAETNLECKGVETIRWRNGDEAKSNMRYLISFENKTVTSLSWYLAECTDEELRKYNVVNRCRGQVGDKEISFESEITQKEGNFVRKSRVTLNRYTGVMSLYKTHKGYDEILGGGVETTMTGSYECHQLNKKF